MQSVKIGIDVRRMTEFGVGTYIRNVVRSLSRLDRENEYFLIGPPAKVKEMGVLPPNFHNVPILAPDRSVQGYPESFFRPAVFALSVCNDRARHAGAPLAGSPTDGILGRMAFADDQASIAG